MALITLTTDFGTRDGFVGALKGVILGIAPSAQIHDLSHEIPRHDIRAGAFALRTAVPHFPQGTIHLVVVDPGVGGSRQPMIAEWDGQWLVLPDNGLISLLPKRETPLRAYRIEHSGAMETRLSRTFHGRDLFAPVAARLACGADPASFGAVIEAPVRLPTRTPRLGEGILEGEVQHIDLYGNIVTNLEARLVPEGAFSIGLHGHWIGGPMPCYEAVPVGQALALIGSHGFVEIALNQGRADQRYHAEIGTEVVLTTDGDLSAGR